MKGIQGAPDDVVIEVCQHLSVRDILAFRQTCRHAFAVSCFKILWMSLCATRVTSRGIPFPDTDRVNEMSARELEVAVREALERDHRLHSRPTHNYEYEPKGGWIWQATSRSAVSEVLFVPDPTKYESRCMVTVSKGISCLICLWDIQVFGLRPEVNQTGPTEVGRWSPEGAIFTAIAVNSDRRSEASAAVAVNLSGQHLVYIFSFFDNASSGYAPRIHVLRTWNPSLSVCSSVSLRGDTLVVADSCDRAIVVSARSPKDRAVVLESSTIFNHPQTSNTCLQIQISQRYILVARAKFVDVFDCPMHILRAEPALRSSKPDFGVGNNQGPIIQHPVDSLSFGWLDAISISQDITKPESFFVLSLQPNRDPQSRDEPTLTFHRLEANSTAGVEEGTSWPSATPDSTSHVLSKTFLASAPLSISYRPVSTSRSFSPRLVVGCHRTALWLSPQPGWWELAQGGDQNLPFRARGGLVMKYSSGGNLVWASFGPRRTKAKLQTDYDENWAGIVEGEDLKTSILTNQVIDMRQGWTAVGYEEETGRVALGSLDGCINFIHL